MAIHDYIFPFYSSLLAAQALGSRQVSHILLDSMVGRKMDAPKDAHIPILRLLEPMTTLGSVAKGN